MATPRHRFTAIFGVAVLLTAVFGTGVASAQTPGYPVGGGSQTCAASTASAGTVKANATITFSLCGGFVPNSSVNITVNGAPGGTKTADANGRIVVIIVITSNTTALVNDPVQVPVNCGANAVVATGQSANGIATATGAFNLDCTPATPTGGLAFTGANIFKFLAGALLLIIVGGALVLGQRRRRSHAA